MDTTDSSTELGEMTPQQPAAGGDEAGPVVPRPSLLDVLHVVACAGFIARDCLAALTLKRASWTDTRLWGPLINVKYKYTPRGMDKEREDTRLMRECREGSEAAVHRLLGLKADVNVRNNESTTPLILASQEGRVAFVHVLIAAGVDVNHVCDDSVSSLMIASQKGHEAVVHALIASGADVDHADNDGDSSLILASQKGHEAVVHALIAAGANV